MKKNIRVFFISCLILAFVLLTVISTGFAAHQKITIRVLSRYAGADAIKGLMADLEKQFMKKHPNVIIQDDSVADENAYNTLLQSNIATGNIPNMFMWPGVKSLTAWAKNGILMDLSPLKKDKAFANGFVPGSMDIWDLGSYGVKGIYGLPYAFQPEVIYYNPDLFAKAGITKVPETMDELYTVIDKLKTAKIIPWGLGAKSTWRAGHIINNLIYKTMGVDGVKNIGARKAQWTDPNAVQAFALLKDLKARGAFEEGCEGVDYDTERAGFFAGKYAMTCNGAWLIGDIMASDSPYKNKFKFFKFPYLKEKPQFKEDLVLFTTAHMYSGKLKGQEKALTIEFAKMLHGKQWQEKLVNDYQRMPARVDLTVDKSKISSLMNDMLSYMKTIKKPGGDCTDYDQVNGLMPKFFDSSVGVLVGQTPEDAAKAIQDMINQSN